MANRKLLARIPHTVGLLLLKGHIPKKKTVNDFENAISRITHPTAKSRHSDGHRVSLSEAESRNAPCATLDLSGHREEVMERERKVNGPNQTVQYVF